MIILRALLVRGLHCTDQLTYYYNQYNCSLTQTKHQVIIGVYLRNRELVGSPRVFFLGAEVKKVIMEEREIIQMTSR